MRWYDNYPELKASIEKLKDMPPVKRQNLMTNIMKVINESEYAQIIDEHAISFPLSLSGRRWYDKDPYLWLIINGLKFTDEGFLKKVSSVINYGKKNYQPDPLTRTEKYKNQ